MLPAWRRRTSNSGAVRSFAWSGAIFTKFGRAPPIRSIFIGGPVPAAVARRVGGWRRFADLPSSRPHTGPPASAASRLRRPDRLQVFAARTQTHPAPRMAHPTFHRRQAAIGDRETAQFATTGFRRLATATWKWRRWNRQIAERDKLGRIHERHPRAMTSRTLPHSEGGTKGFWLAKLLLREGREPVFVVAFEHWSAESFAQECPHPSIIGFGRRLRLLPELQRYRKWINIELFSTTRPRCLSDEFRGDEPGRAGR